MKHFLLRWNGNEFSFGFGKFSSVSELLEHFSRKPVIGEGSGEGREERVKESGGTGTSLIITLQFRGCVYVH